MKLATWNIERPHKASKHKQSIISCIEKVDADILILTETNELISMADKYHYYHSSTLTDSYYKEGERRVSIYSKYKAVEHVATFRDDTSLCIRFSTPMGELTVYGTVIGIHGNRRTSFMEDLNQQLCDFDKIAATSAFCIAGDLNMSFSDNYYYTTQGRQKLNASFEKLSLLNLTAAIPQNIDHIIISKAFVGNRKTSFETWNTDKTLSDHIGVAISIE